MICTYVCDLQQLSQFHPRSNILGLTDKCIMMNVTAKISKQLYDKTMLYICNYNFICFIDHPIIFANSSSSNPVAGESVTVTCYILLAEGVSHDVHFQWEGPGEIPDPAPSSTVGEVVTSELTLSYIRTSQAGQYTCTASLCGFSVSSTATTNVSVQSKFTCVLHS